MTQARLTTETPSERVGESGTTDFAIDATRPKSRILKKPVMHPLQLSDGWDAFANFIFGISVSVATGSEERLGRCSFHLTPQGRAIL